MVAGGAQALQPPNRQKLEDELLASLEMVALEVSSKQQYDPTNVEPDDGNEFRCAPVSCPAVGLGCLGAAAQAESSKTA